MKIAMVGTGYVGIVSATCFAESGNTVTCVDIDAAKVAQMKHGKVPIYEPRLDELFSRNIKEDRLTFTTNLAEGIKDAEVIFLALPTPPGEDGSADLSYILQVADELGPLLEQYTVVVNKSTVPVGTAEKVSKRILKNAKVPCDVVSNPEFLREGFAVEDFMKPDRVVIGTDSEKAQKIMAELYGPFVRQGNPIFFMGTRSSEMTKYAANAFLAAKISFMNEIANLCELTGADVDSVRLGIGSDNRIGKRFLFPGIGYGGSCFPKDVTALYKTSQEYKYDFKILAAVNEVNGLQKKTITTKINKYYNNSLEGKKFALWGLAFKPDTDDIREAPAIEIINELLKSGASINAFDPEAADNVKKLYKPEDDIRFSDSQYDALDGADALIIATEWNEFRSPDFDHVKQKLREPVIFDGRNLYDLTQMQDEGFYYESVGRKIVNHNE